MKEFDSIEDAYFYWAGLNSSVQFKHAGLAHIYMYIYIYVYICMYAD